MKLKEAFLSLILLLATTTSGWCALQPAEIRSWIQIVQTSAQTTQSYIEIMQMSGSAAQYQQAQVAMQVHQSVYNDLCYLLQNPHLLNDPGVENKVRNNMIEYEYRVRKNDWRPREHIAGLIQQYAQYRRWQVSTAAGQASWQAEQQQNAQAFSNHQAQMQSNQQAFDSYMSNLRRQNHNSDLYHTQYVNGIHDTTQWVDPTTGTNYIVPNSVNQPQAVHNGWATDMVPYQQYYYRP